MNKHNQTITINNKPWTSKDHGELARLIYRRFGDDLFAATSAWRRLLQNNTPTNDFSEILTWYEEPQFTPPIITPKIIFKELLNELSANGLKQVLENQCPVGHITEIRIIKFQERILSGFVDVQKISEKHSNEFDMKTHKFSIIFGYQRVPILRAFGKQRQIKLFSKQRGQNQ